MVLGKIKVLSEQPIINYSREEYPVIDKDETLIQALRLMEKHDVDSVLVVDEKKIIGVMSKRDVMDKLLVERTRRITASRLHVSSFMKNKVITLTPDTSLGEASKVMLTENIDVTPILIGNAKNYFVLRDFLKIFSDINDTFVDEVMGSPKFIARFGERLIHIRQKFIEYNTIIVPVIDYRGIPAGIVTVDEIVKSLVTLHEHVVTRFRRERKNMIYVEDVMRRNFVVSELKEMVGLVAKKIVDENSVGAVVIEENNVVGVLTYIDFARALAFVS